MSYLYSKLPETGVPLLIGTGGTESPSAETWGEVTLTYLVTLNARARR